MPPARSAADRETARRFGLALDGWLTAAELRPADLARRMGKDSAVISKWRRGLMLPNPESCRRLAPIVGKSADEVLAVAGHRPDIDTSGDRLRSEIVALLPLIPDELLAPLPAMLRGLVPHQRKG